MVLEFDLRALCLLGKNILINEVSQVQKAKVHLFSLICGIKINRNKSNIIYTEIIYTEKLCKTWTSIGDQERRKS
jgi:hypothetical protein